MAIVIKEIHVDTIVEKRIVLPTDISDALYDRLKKDIVRELSKSITSTQTKPKER